MRNLLLAALVVAVGAMTAASPVFAQEYPWCSGEGFGAGQSCTFETIEQCRASVQGAGVDCYKNPRYTAPVVTAPPPQPAPAVAPTPQKRRTTAPSGSKS